MWEGNMRRTILAAVAAVPLLALAVPAAAWADGGGYGHHHHQREQPCFWVPLSGTGYQQLRPEYWAAQQGGGYGQSEPVMVSGVKALVCEQEGQQPDQYGQQGGGDTFTIVKVDISGAQFNETEAHQHGGQQG
jgi:hypothetical protein